MNKARLVYILLWQLTLGTTIMAQADFSASVTEGCTPLAVKFSIDLSTVDLDTVTSAVWQIGIADSVITGTDPDTMIYNRMGNYAVTLIINGDEDAAVSKPGYITAHKTQRAAFIYEEFAPNHNYRFIPLDPITDTTATYFYMWRYTKDLPGSDISNDITVDYESQLNAIDSVILDTGIYRVGLRVEDTWGCLSRYQTELIVRGEIELPNVFIPRSEADFYTINPNSLSTILKIQIFNRYGVMVFTQTAPVINWNGKNNTGKYLTTGVYYYILESVDGDPLGLYDKQGFIHLYR